MHMLVLSLVVALVTLACVVFFSKRAIRPEIENARRQQQFMTNASHELKTPIAVIRANTEVTEMLSGETEWTRSTISQVDRLEALVGDLMAIIRDQEEASGDSELGEVDVTAVVGKAANSFKSVAQQGGIELSTELAEGVALRGNAATIEQLTCLLMDNAIKYCDAHGTVEVKLAPSLLGRGCTLAISNDYAQGADVDYRRFFERFYREDQSHGNQKGMGIGLPVAQSICERYHGSIKASWKAGRITFTCQLKDA
jgi:signal transduction histidine kinase